MKAKSILKDQREHCHKYLDDNVHVNFSFIPLVLETDSVMKTPQCKIKSKNKKCKKLRPKKLRAYIPNKAQALSPLDLLKWQDKNILIIGKPGVGKTTVVQEMLCIWAEKDGREIDYMFYFDESVLAHNSVASLESLLFDVYSKPMEKDRMDVFQDIEENSNNVVIAFDCVMGLKENSILWKIMNHELLPDAKIVITCRSEYNPLFCDWPTRKMYVQGFSEESIQTYYQKMLGQDPVLLDVVLKNQELFSLSHVPMYAFMVVAFIPFRNDTKNNHPHTVTEMYIHIFRLAMMTHGKKQIEEIDKYLRGIKDQVYHLMENAFNATMKKTLNFISCDETDICHAFLKMITIRDSLSSATKYCAFLHNTMQEFFSALWLLGHPDEIEKVLQLCQTEEHKHMRHVLPFLCGLLSKHNIRLLKCLFPENQIKKTSDWFIEKLLDTFLQPQSDGEEFDLLYVCQCLCELQSPKACLMFLEKMDHHLEPEEDLDPHQCCALSYVIAQSRDKEVYLNLEDCTMADVGMNMILTCSPNIRLNICKEPLKQTTFFLEFFHKASHCCCNFSDQRYNYNYEPLRALLDLYSHVKNYESQTGRSFLPALQSVFQSAPDVWIIDLSQRMTSLLLEVLKLQTEKKPVELRGCTEEESEMMSFLQCLPYISQLRFDYWNSSHEVQFVWKLFIKAEEIETQTEEQMLKLLSSVCTYSSFPYESTDRIKQSNFLLDFYSHLKNYETQTGRSFLPVLQLVFLSADVWSIDLSQRKSSVLLEVLKLQTEKKPVELRGCSEEESEVMSFLLCLPYISQLRFDHWNSSHAVQFVLKVFIKAAETEIQTGEQMLKPLTSVCTYSSFPYEWTDRIKQINFLLDLYSHVENYETQTSRSFLPVLQSVFQSPDVWIIDPSQRKISLILEVLKLQTEKKPVELRGCSKEESEMMSVLQCLPYISQLRYLNFC
uniref:NACHT domain-containing protein n=1 Tax=Cyprinus carpio TaxID=7962 RepID=A0A8C2F5C9_CYPCA